MSLRVNPFVVFDKEYKDYYVRYQHNAQEVVRFCRNKLKVYTFFTTGEISGTKFKIKGLRNQKVFFKRNFPFKATEHYV